MASLASALELTVLTSEFISFSSCCICFDEYNEGLNRPKMLPCLHTFCLNCIKVLAPHKCPLCSKPFPVDGIESFPINQYALYIIRLMSHLMSLETHLRAAQLETSAEQPATVDIEVPQHSECVPITHISTASLLETTAMSSRHQTISQATPSAIIKCRSIRVGTYKYLPLEAQCCVRISKKGFLITVPFPHDATRFHCIAILSESLQKVEAHFSQTLTVISLLVAPIVSRRESNHLKIPNRNPGLKWDSLSSNDCERYLTIVSTEMSEDSKHLVKSSFRAHGVFREINRNEASRRLITAAPRLS